ncbi:MAG: hypothetical protein VZQ81_01135 [Succiniclasticum sp.]|jgi:uncharacterized protein (DUF697 family)|nr:hypothetical protein [Succiniclasticum sp.]MEE3478618.1 hypothetical protein [Succiniclasticum sp.]
MSDEEKKNLNEETAEQAETADEAKAEAAAEQAETAEAAADAAEGAETEEKTEETAEAAEETAEEDEETKPEEAEEAEPETKPEPLKDIDTEWEAEKICRWGAARASVIVVAPLLGSMALIANEVYMITRLADLRGITLSEGAAMGLLGSLGATFVGQSVATIIPMPALQIPLAISITYGVGKAANAWLKAGRPEDIAAFREVYEKARKEGADNADTFSKMDCRNKPLGDETKKFDIHELKEQVKNLNSEDIFNNVKAKADKAESSISARLRDINERIVNPLKNKSDRWLSAQNWKQLSRGELVIPYSEIRWYMVQALAGSDFALLDIGYQAPDYMTMELQHNSYGTLSLKLSILDFFVDQSEATAHIKVEGFDIFNNEFASLIVNTIGDKLILGILDLAFDKVTIENKDVVTTYEDGVIGLDFTKTLQESKLGKTRFLEKSVLDVLHFTDLSVVAEGLKLKATVKL